MFWLINKKITFNCALLSGEGVGVGIYHVWVLQKIEVLTISRARIQRGNRVLISKYAYIGNAYKNMYEKK